MTSFQKSELVLNPRNHKIKENQAVTEKIVNQYYTVNTFEEL